jgi:hypothetical protein
MDALTPLQRQQRSGRRLAGIATALEKTLGSLAEATGHTEDDVYAPLFEAVNDANDVT